MAMYTVNGRTTSYFGDDKEENKKKLERMNTADLIALSEIFYRKGLKKVLVNYLSECKL